MKTLLAIHCLVLFASTHAAFAQGTVIYDRQSATESSGGGLAIAIQPNQPIG
jgi:hypothetical protein